MVARRGDSAVVEYADGRLGSVRAAVPAMTNFVLTSATPRRRRPLPHRDRHVPRRSRRLLRASTLDLLARVAQPHTRWSVAYDLRARTAHVVMGQKYGGRVLKFSVAGGTLLIALSGHVRSVTRA